MTRFMTGDWTQVLASSAGGPVTAAVFKFYISCGHLVYLNSGTVLWYILNKLDQISFHERLKKNYNFSFWYKPAKTWILSFPINYKTLFIVDMIIFFKSTQITLSGNKTIVTITSVPTKYK